MIAIPRIFNPQPDELLYSWQDRLSKANGFDHLYEFARTVIYPNCRTTKQRADRRVSIDGREDFIPFAKALGLTSLERMIELYLGVTIFPALIPIYTEMQQQDFLRTALDGGGRSDCKRKLRPIFTALRYCPLCRQEDYNTLGYTYIRRAHQLPGVTVCHEHGVKLLSSSSLNVSEEPISQGTDDEINYANFIFELLNTRLCTSWTDISHDIANRAGDTVNNLNSRIPSTAGYLRLFQTYGNAAGLLRIFPNDPLALNKRIGLIWTQLSTQTAFPVKRVRTQNSFESEVHDLCGNEYTVLSFSPKHNGTPSTAVLRHEKCGRVQSYRVEAFLDGRRCAHCTHFVFLSALQDFVKHQSCGRYEVVGRDGVNLTIIRDTHSNRTIALSQSRIIQELQRPTPSSLLPCTHPSTGTKMPSTLTDSFFDYLRKAYPDGAEIFLSRLSYRDLPYQTLKRLIQSLVTRGDLIRTGKGRYCLSGAENVVSLPRTKLMRVWEWIQDNYKPGETISLQELKYAFQNEISYGELKQITIRMRSQKMIHLAGRGIYVRNDIQ